jgi:5,10-methylenetetrahydrofolate reductase
MLPGQKSPAIQSDILAAALGIRNIMVVQGEDVRFGDHPSGTGRERSRSHGTLEALQKLHAGKDLAGIELKGAPRFSMGSTLDTGASGGLLNIELENLKKKVDLGVEYVVTNPIFDVRRLEQFVKRMEGVKIAVIPTVLLLKSAGLARYIDRNIKGIPSSGNDQDIQKP